MTSPDRRSNGPALTVVLVVALAAVLVAVLVSRHHGDAGNQSSASDPAVLTSAPTDATKTPENPPADQAGHGRHHHRHRSDHARPDVVTLAPSTPSTFSTPSPTTPSATTTTPPSNRRGPHGAPSQAQWEADVRAAMKGSKSYLVQRAKRGNNLAINLDIDNTSLATSYDAGTPVRPTLAFAQKAHELGMKVFFNTGRSHAQAAQAARQLARVGYPVDAMCSRDRGQPLARSKQQCRRSFRSRGYVLVANVGNSPTDFTGSGYERAFRLPNYGGRLG